MGHNRRELLALTRTRFGRWRLAVGVLHRAWPLLSRLAGVWRATVTRETRVVAVVGSLGKTTTARATATVLGRDPNGLAQNYFSHLATGVLATRPHERHAVFEVGISQPGTMERYARMLRPDIVVVTSVTTEHHMNFPNLGVTRMEKAAMVRQLSPSGVAVLNGDDANVRWMASQTQALVRTFGFDAQNDVRASECTLDWPRGMRLTLHVDGATRVVRVRLLGRHMAYPILAAVTVALAEGVSLDAAVTSLEALAPAAGRMETVPLPNGAFLLRDDYKGTPETIEFALDVLAELPARRRFVVLGDAQESPESLATLYSRLGARLAAIADRAVFVHLDADSDRYIPGALRAGAPAAALTEATSGVREVARILGDELRPGDVVLVKGAGAQRLERVALELTGRTVRCELAGCGLRVITCSKCPMLERGWGGSVRVVV